MEIDKPQISILMAIYEPRLDWLREQLTSLNSQTYPNIKLFIRDDCSKKVNFAEIEKLVQDCIIAFPYELKKNDKNLGSTRTFELLTNEADGEFFAYCDQDDIWLSQKLELLEKQLVKDRSELICSDVTPIDKDGSQIAESITSLRPRHKFFEGNGLASSLIYKNFAMGCTMLIKKNSAKASLPFATSMVHDHYIAFFCALRGSISVCKSKLVYYRLHECNQTSILCNVSNKETYKISQIDMFYHRVEELKKRFVLPELDVAKKWADSRLKNINRQKGGFRELWHYRYVNFGTSLFELFALRMPNFIFNFLVKEIQNGRI